jgi:hypothetical protein
MTHESLEAKLLQLPADARAHLARVLIESLDEQPELDPGWLEEAERRAAELAAGTAETVPAADAIAEARRRLTG